MSVNVNFMSINNQPLSAIDLFSKQIENNKIVTMCHKFDEMLGGGITCGTLTEICGHAGIGKTQICFQTCITVQIPQCLGGMEGQAVYIDTEGSFSTNRLLQIAKYTLAHCKRIAKSLHLSENEMNMVTNLNENDILKSIFYFRATDQDQLLALTHRLHGWCQIHARVRLIIIDSIAFHFRYDGTDDIPRRNRVLSVLGHNLTKLATQFGVAVILANQMTTKFIDGVGFATPALGESWGHICHTRIQLQQPNSSQAASSSVRQAVLIKHASQPVSSSHYQITVNY